MFGRMFDFNRDGKSDAVEIALAFSTMDDLDNENDTQADEDDEDRIETLEQLEQLREELLSLHNELEELDCREPEVGTDAYARWDERKALLEDQLSDVEDEINELEAELNDI